MTVVSFVGRFLVFLACFAAGSGVWMLFSAFRSVDVPVSEYRCHRGSGFGTASDKAPEKYDLTPDIPAPRDTRDIVVTRKPRPGYTDLARTNNEQGKVLLRVTFTAQGQIGNVSVVKGLDYGLTEMAVAAALKIEFSPRLVDGQPQTVTKQVEYSFSLY